MTTTTSPIAATLADISRRGVYQLTHDAGIANPDTRTSPGAEFITWVRDHIVERVEWITTQEHDDLNDYDGPSDIVAVSQLLELIDDSRGTWRTWQAFTDLCGWQVVDEYVAETGGPITIDDEASTTDRVCLLGLSVIAERVAEHLAEEILAARA